MTQGAHRAPVCRTGDRSIDRGVREVENNIRVEKQDRTGDASLADFSRYGAQGKSVGGRA